jgi:hypothetical protein
MMRTSLGSLTLMLSLWAATTTALAASADLRDPTELPSALRQPLGQDSAAAPAMANIVIQQLMVVEGRYFLVVGGRRLRTGDKLGAARIARIEDSAVWLTEDGVTRKQSLFAGVEKRAERLAAAPAEPATPKKSAKSAQTAQTAQTDQTDQTAPPSLPLRPSRAATPSQENR